MKKAILTRDDIKYEVAGHSLVQILNFNEVHVLDVMNEIYEEDSSLCRCSICIEDIYALSLNKISPRYIQATSLEIYESSPNYIGKDEIKAKVLNAVKMVKEKPGH